MVAVVPVDRPDTSITQFNWKPSMPFLAVGLLSIAIALFVEFGTDGFLSGWAESFLVFYSVPWFAVLVLFGRFHGASLSAQLPITLSAVL